MKFQVIPAFLLALLLIISGCDKDAQFSDVNMSLSFNVDGSAVTLGEKIYQNPAGNTFSVTDLRFYLSDIKLTRDNGEVYLDDGVHYVELEDASTTTITLSEIPVGTYNKFEATLGVSNDMNISDNLPATTENQSMGWPEPMGGGYHHMMMNGRFNDSAGTDRGYGMHLGRNNYQPVNVVSGINLVFDEETETFSVSYDIMEWHKNPENWDFDIDGVSIMGDLDAQQKLSDNGVDVLSVQ